MTYAPWYLAGPLIGLVIVGLLWVAGTPVGSLGGYVDTADWLRRQREALGWRAYLFFGVVLGGLAFTLATGRGATGFGYGTFDALVGGSMGVKAIVLLGAGTLMGFGARTAGGCTSGHGVCGMSLAQPASLVATMTFMATAVGGAHLMQLALGGAR